MKRFDTLRAAVGAGGGTELPDAVEAQLADIESRFGPIVAQRRRDALERVASDVPLGAPEHDPVEFLESAEGRSALSDLVKSALGRRPSPDVARGLNRILLRLRDLPAEHPDALAFAHAGARAALGQRTGAFQSREKHFNVQDARDALLGCKDVFDRHGRRFFLDRGTLLGCVREAGFIASDYDIDVGIFADEVSLADVREMFADTDYEISQDFEYKVGLLSPGGIQIDFFLTSRHDGYFLSKGYRSVHNWYFTPFELMPYPFLGDQFYVPANLEQHLQENYGNWRHPAIFYDLSYNEPCVAYGHHSRALLYLAKRFRRAIDRGDRYHAESPLVGLHRRFDLDYRDRFAPPLDLTRRADSAQVVDVIRVVDTFDSITHHVRRVVETALDLAPDVELAVLDTDRAEHSLDDRRFVASSLARVARVVSVDVSSALDVSDAHRAVVVEAAALTDLDPSRIVHTAEQGCDVISFDDRTAAVTLDGSRIVTRRVGEAGPVPSGNGESP